MASSDNSIIQLIEKEGNLFQQIAMLIWLEKGDEYEKVYDTVTGVKTWVEMMQALDKGEGLEAIKTALMGWLHTGFGGRGVVQESLTSSNIIDQLLQFVNKEDRVQELRNEALLSIANFVQQNPDADEETMRQEVVKHILIFAEQVENT